MGGSCAEFFRYPGRGHVCCVVSYKHPMYVRWQILSNIDTSYSAAIEMSIFVSQAIWLLRTREIRRRAKEAKVSWAEFPEAKTWEDDRWRWGWKTRFSSKSSDVGGAVSRDPHDVEQNVGGDEFLQGDSAK